MEIIYLDSSIIIVGRELLLSLSRNARFSLLFTNGSRVAGDDVASLFRNEKILNHSFFPFSLFFSP